MTNKQEKYLWARIKQSESRLEALEAALKASGVSIPEPKVQGRKRAGEPRVDSGRAHAQG